MYPKACRQMKKMFGVFFCLSMVVECVSLSRLNKKRQIKGEIEYNTYRTRIDAGYQKPLFDVWLHLETLSLLFLSFIFDFFFMSVVFDSFVANGKVLYRKLTNKFNGNKYAPCFPNI